MGWLCVEGCLLRGAGLKEMLVSTKGCLLAKCCFLPRAVVCKGPLSNSPLAHEVVGRGSWAPFHCLPWTPCGGQERFVCVLHPLPSFLVAAGLTSRMCSSQDCWTRGTRCTTTTRGIPSRGPTRHREMVLGLPWDCLPCHLQRHPRPSSLPGSWRLESSAAVVVCFLSG